MTIAHSDIDHQLGIDIDKFLCALPSTPLSYRYWEFAMIPLAKTLDVRPDQHVLHYLLGELFAEPS